MPTLPPKLQTLNGFRLVYPPNPPYQGGLIWFDEKLGLALSTPLPPYQRVIIWFGRQSSGQTRGNGNISHDESQNVASGQQEVCAVGRPFGRFGNQDKRTGSPAIPFLGPQDKRTGSPHKRTGSPQVFSWSLILGSGSSMTRDVKPKSLILGSSSSFKRRVLNFKPRVRNLKPKTLNFKTRVAPGLNFRLPVLNFRPKSPGP